MSGPGLCRRVSKFATKSVEKWSDEQWWDMGMLSVTLYAYTNMDNKITVDV